MLVVIIGFFSGILSGLAVGGGTLLVPALIFLLGTSQHIAQGISLASFLPTASVAVITHLRHGNVRPRLAMFLALGSILGAVGGALLAVHISAPLLQKIFGFFLMGMGTWEFCGRQKKCR